MTTKLFKTFLKLKLFSLLPIEESYFKSITLESKKKISHDVVLLNYSDYSPYKEFSLIFAQEKNKIDLWFTPKKLENNLILPESYIFLNYFNKMEKEGIILFDTIPQKLFLIKESQLKYQLSKKKISNYEISLLQKEFSTSQIEQYKESEYQEIFDAAIEKLAPRDFFKFLSFEFNYKNILNIFVKKSAIPIAVFISLLLGVEIVNKFYLENQLSHIESDYKEVREKSASLRDKVYDIEDQSKIYTLLEEELQINQKFMNIIKNLSQTLQENNSTFLFLRVSPSEFRLKIDTNATTKVFSEIVKSHLIQDLRIQSTRKNRQKDGESVIITGKIN